MHKVLRLIPVFLLFSMPVFGWGPKGHRTIAEVAYRYLTNEARQAVDSLLGTHGLVYLSTWPDEIRSEPKIHPEPLIIPVRGCIRAKDSIRV